MSPRARIVLWQLVLTIPVSVIASLAVVWALSALTGMRFQPAIVGGVSAAVACATVLQSSRKTRGLSRPPA